MLLSKFRDDLFCDIILNVVYNIHQPSVDSWSHPFSLYLSKEGHDENCHYTIPQHKLSLTNRLGQEASLGKSHEADMGLFNDNPY